MNLKVYRARTWPFAPDSFVLVTWGKSTRASDERVIDRVIIPNTDEDEFEGVRFRGTLGLRYPGGTTDIDFWIDYVKDDAERALQGRIDESWLGRGLPGTPPVVELGEVEPLKLFSLRFRGRGEKGLSAVEDVTRDTDTRDFARALLGISPIEIERIPNEDER